MGGYFDTKTKSATSWIHDTVKISLSIDYQTIERYRGSKKIMCGANLIVAPNSQPSPLKLGNLPPRLLPSVDGGCPIIYRQFTSHWL